MPARQPGWLPGMAISSAIQAACVILVKQVCLVRDKSRAVPA
jgi:hypothetical protein